MKYVIKENKGIIILGSIFKVIVSLMLVLTTLLTSKLLDSAVSGDINDLIKQTIIIVIAWIITLLADYVSGIIIATAIRKMNNTVRERTVEGISLLSHERFNDRDTGEYVSWLTNDINQIESNAFSNMFDVLGNISSVIFSIFGLLSIHYSVVISALFFSILILVLPKFIGTKMETKTNNLSIKQANFTSKIKDQLLGFDVLYSFNVTNNIKERIVDASDILEVERYGLKKYSLKTNQIIGGIRVVSQVTMIFITSFLVANGLTTVGVIFPATDLSGRLFSSISGLVSRYVVIKSTKPIFTKLNSISSFKKNEKKVNFNEIYEVRNLSFSYDGKQVLDNLNIVFERGKKYALVGASGSGKSTLIKLLMGHLTDYSGDILMDKIDIKEISNQSLKNNIAYVSQNVYLFTDTVKDNILLNQEYADIEFNEAIEKSSLKEFLNSLDNKEDTMVYENGKNLSGGQKQRIALARALIRKKPIIIIDEGTSALDNTTSAEIETQLLTDKDLTVIMISHNLNSDLISNFDEIINL